MYSHAILFLHTTPGGGGGGGTDQEPCTHMESPATHTALGGTLTTVGCLPGGGGMPDHHSLSTASPLFSTTTTPTAFPHCTPPFSACSQETCSPATCTYLHTHTHGLYCTAHHSLSLSAHATRLHTPAASSHPNSCTCTCLHFCTPGVDLHSEFQSEKKEFMLLPKPHTHLEYHLPVLACVCVTHQTME